MQSEFHLGWLLGCCSYEAPLGYCCGCHCARRTSEATQDRKYNSKTICCQPLAMPGTHTHCTASCSTGGAQDAHAMVEGLLGPAMMHEEHGGWYPDAHSMLEQQGLLVA